MTPKHSHTDPITSMLAALALFEAHQQSLSDARRDKKEADRRYTYACVTHDQRAQAAACTNGEIALQQAAQAEAKMTQVGLRIRELMAEVEGVLPEAKEAA